MDTPGRFGTVQLLRRQPTSTAANASKGAAGGAAPAGEEVVVASFGVDTPTVSFGRDPTCSVRLYYPAVAPLHARIVFSGDESEKKKNAFVEVLGAKGMHVDGCMVYPNAQDDGGSPKGVRTIPLGNGSELEIHGKRFRFVYPPKEMRKALAASPARPGNRALRLSLIPSAQVFDPHPSPDPRQNLRVLQSPLRIAGSSPKKNGSPAPGTPTPSPRGVVNSAKTQQDDEDSEEGQTITLVQGSHPRVVEEAKDLVILEDVELSAEERAAAANNNSRSSPTTAVGGAGRGRANSTSAGSVGRNPSIIPPPPPPPAPPRTPRRQSLHRAVLIRSAQRAVWAANSPASTNSGSNSGSNSSTPSAGSSNSSAGSVLRGWQAPAASTTVGADVNRGEEEDEADDETDTEEEEAEVRSLRLEVVSVSSGSESEDEGDDEDDANDNSNPAPQPRLGWRKSLERIALWPFGGRVKKEEEDTVLPPASAEDEGHDNDEDHEENEDHEDQNEGYENDDDEMDAQIQTPRTGSPRTPTFIQTPVQRTPAPARSPAKTPAVPRSPTKTSAQAFGAPHPAARTPPGFKRKSIPGHEAAERPAADAEEAANVPMDVDEEGYTPLYEDLASYRLGNPPTTDADRTSNAQDAARAKASTPPPIRPARPLAAFMTPQAPRAGFAAYGVPGSAKPAGGAPRYSLGGAARRVPVEDKPWKVNELLMPGTPSAGQGTPARGVPVRPALSAEERRAISERRRSALKMPDPFFAGGVPGMSPAKKKVGVPGLGLGRVQEGAATGNVETEGTTGGKQDDRLMLENLRETVAGLRRRRESVLADAGIVTEADVDVSEGEGRVEFQAHVEKPKSRMLRGRSREKSPARGEVEENTNQAHTEVSTPAETAMEIDVPSKPARRGRKPTTPTPVVTEDPEEMVVDPAPASKPARRTRKATVEPEGEAELSAPAAPRSTRKATPTPTTEDEEHAEMAVDPAPVKARRTRKPTAEPEVVNDDEPAAPADVPAAPTKPRRGRKATTEPESEAETAAAPARRARKPPSTDATAAVPATEPAAPPKRRGRTAKAPTSAPERKTRGRSRAAAEETQTEADDDADPLDTITDVDIVPDVPKTRRSRSAKPKAVKEEEAEPVLEGEGTAVPTVRAGRTKKSAAAAVPAVPAAPKPRSTRKATVPASAPAVVEIGEKENAPDEEREESEPVAKVRVSRSRKVKEEVVESDAPVAAPRRATRTRTKTG